MSCVIERNRLAARTHKTGSQVIARGFGQREDIAMHSSPAKPLIATVTSPWLPPIEFRIEPYMKLCDSINRSLRDLETRFPSHRPGVTLETRKKLLKRKPK